MPTKKKRKPTKRVKRNPLLDRLPKNREEYLQLLIRLTERNITNNGTDLDAFFVSQAEKLKKQLAELRNPQ
jgi:hypothetical protein